MTDALVTAVRAENAARWDGVWSRLGDGVLCGLCCVHALQKMLNGLFSSLYLSLEPPSSPLLSHRLHS